jgi:F-type H+-transporting ATPase subunit delta
MKLDQTYLDALASALLQELPAADVRERIENELEAAATVLREDPSLVYQPKRLEALFAKHLHPAAWNALRMLSGKRMLSAANRVSVSMRTQRHANERVREAVVRSAEPLSAKEREDIQRRLSKRFHMDIVLREQHDPTIVGGLIIQSGDWQYDASIAGSLRRLADTLIHSPSTLH